MEEIDITKKDNKNKWEGWDSIGVVDVRDGKVRIYTRTYKNGPALTTLTRYYADRIEEFVNGLYLKKDGFYHIYANGEGIDTEIAIGDREPHPNARDEHVSVPNVSPEFSKRRIDITDTPPDDDPHQDDV